MVHYPELQSLHEGIPTAPRSVDVKDGKSFHLDKEVAQYPVSAQLPLAFLCEWDPVRFVFQRSLPQVTRSGCPIEIYADCLTGSMVIAKRFPVEQVTNRIRAMRQSGPTGLVNAWPELVLTQRLGCEGLAGFCACFGAFNDDNGDVLLVSEYIPGGDLFELALNLCEPGPAREKQALPVIHSLIKTVMRLHACGVAHCDISLENALKRPGPDGEVVLIDFETALSGDACQRRGVCGKPFYQAPEMYTRKVWDAYAADLFACGVAAYCLAMGNYPWKSTKPGVCRRFAIFQKFGFRAILMKRAVLGGIESRQTIGTCLSPYLTNLLEVLLHPQPEARMGALTLLACAEHDF